MSDRRGDIAASPDEPHGLFYRDTQFLSRWSLRVGDGDLEVLSTENVDYFAAQFFLYPPTGTINENPSARRRRGAARGGPPRSAS